MTDEHMSVSRLVKPRRMHEDVFEKIREDIYRGVYSIGELMPSERVLSEMFGVSRVTIREALTTLEKSGLVVLRSGRRARVVAPSSESIVNLLSTAALFHISRPGGLKHFQEVRLALEPGVARLAAERVGSGAVEALEAALDENLAAIGDVDRFAKSDVEFHRQTAEIVGNPMLNGFYVAVDNWLSETRVLTLAVEGQMQVVYEAHKLIFEAIKSRKPEAADAAMRKHLEQVVHILQDAFKEI